MSDRRFKQSILAVLILAALLRVLVLVTGETLPVMWDARRYASAALGVLSYVDNDYQPDERNVARDRMLLLHMQDKYIQGEKIDWLFYQPHSLTQARDDIYFSGPLYPTFLAGVFFISPVADFTVARIFGILFDLMALWLMVQIARRLVGEKPAIVAGVLYAVYLPFALTSTLLLLETSTSLLILAAVFWAIKATEKAGRIYLLLSGLACGLLILNKPTAMLIGGPVLVGLFFYARKEWKPRQLAVNAAMWCVPLLMVFGGWLAAASMKYGQVTLRDPSYAGANIRQSSSLLYEGYDLDLVDDKFWERDPYGDVAERPLEYLGLFAKKFERLWSKPYNDFDRNLLQPDLVQKTIHFVVVFGGLVGLMLLLLRFPHRAAWPLLIVLYYLGIHLIFHSINRYSFNALPLVMVCSGYGLIQIWTAIKTGSKNAAPILAALFAILLINLFGLLPGLGGAWISVLVGALAGASIFWIVTRGTAINRIARIAATVAIIILVGSVGWSQNISRRAGAEFEVELNQPDQVAGIRVDASRIGFDQEDSYFIAIDASTTATIYELHLRNRQDPFTTMVNSTEPFFFAKKPVYTSYARFLQKEPQQFRQYNLVPIAREKLMRQVDSVGYLDIEVSVTGFVNSDDQYLAIGGSRYRDAGPHYIPNPEGDRASIERFVHRGDARIRIPVEFASDSTISYYIDPEEDLSQERVEEKIQDGRIEGRLNIFLIRVTPDGRYEVY